MYIPLKTTLTWREYTKKAVSGDMTTESLKAAAAHGIADNQFITRGWAHSQLWCCSRQPVVLLLLADESCMLTTFASLSALCR